MHVREGWLSRFGLSFSQRRKKDLLVKRLLLRDTQRACTRELSRTFPIPRNPQLFIPFLLFSFDSIRRVLAFPVTRQILEHPVRRSNEIAALSIYVRGKYVRRRWIIYYSANLRYRGKVRYARYLKQSICRTISKMLRIFISSFCFFAYILFYCLKSLNLREHPPSSDR